MSTRTRSSSGGAGRLDELDESGEGLLEARGRSGAEKLDDLLLDVREHRVHNRLEFARPLREEEACSARVVRGGPACDEAVAFQETCHRRHGLLAQTCAACKLAESEAVFLEERDEQGAVRRTHLGEARVSEAMFEDLVPASAREREQVAGIGAVSCHLRVRARRRRRGSAGLGPRAAASRSDARR